MNFFEILLSLFLIFGFIYWVDAMRARGIARLSGKVACDKAGLIFLDDTVVLHKIRFRRDGLGRLGIYRKYCFEFTSDGSQRYNGEISMFAKHVVNLTMEPYRIP
jgi:Protein of unknown function (DUF3301)